MRSFRILHLHCRKDDTQPAREAEEIAATAGLPAETLVSLRPFDGPISFEALDRVHSVVIGGSAWSVFEDIPYYEGFRDLVHEARRRGLPIFGICFGAQAIAHVFGGTVRRDAARAEYGTIEVRRVQTGDPLFDELPNVFHAQAWHHDRITALPTGAVPAAWSQSIVLQAFFFRNEPIRGVQFHPERSQEAARQMLAARGAPCDAHPADRIRDSLRPSPEASSLLARFLRLRA